MKKETRQVATTIPPSTSSTSGDKADFILQAHRHLCLHDGYIYNGSNAR